MRINCPRGLDHMDKECALCRIECYPADADTAGTTNENKTDAAQETKALMMRAARSPMQPWRKIIGGVE